MADPNGTQPNEAKKAQEKEIKKPYKVLSNLRHSSKHYAPDSTVKLTDKEAETLLAFGVVSGPVKNESEK